MPETAPCFIRVLSLTMPKTAPYFRRVLDSAKDSAQLRKGTVFDYAKDSALLPKGIPSLTMPKNERKTNIIVIDCGSGSQGQAEEKLG